MQKLSVLASLFLMATTAFAQTGIPWPAHNPGAGIVSVTSGTITNATTTYKSTGLSLPLPANTTGVGRCVLVWSSSSTSGTPTFAAQYSAAPTSSSFQSVTLSTAYSGTNTTLASTTQTAITAALTPTAATTNYRTEADFEVINGTTATVLTFYFVSNSTSFTITFNTANSFCAWL